MKVVVAGWVTEDAWPEDWMGGYPGDKHNPITQWTYELDGHPEIGDEVVVSLPEDMTGWLTVDKRTWDPDGYLHVGGLIKEVG